MRLSFEHFILFIPLLLKHSWHALPAAQRVVREVAPVVHKGEFVGAGAAVVAGVEAGRGVGPGDVELVVGPERVVGQRRPVFPL